MDGTAFSHKQKTVRFEGWKEHSVSHLPLWADSTVLFSV